MAAPNIVSVATIKGVSLNRGINYGSTKYCISSNN